MKLCWATARFPARPGRRRALAVHCSSRRLVRDESRTTMSLPLPAIIGSDSFAEAKPPRRHLAFRIGGMSFGLFSDDDIAMALDPGLRDFQIEPPAVDIQIRVSWTDRLE